MLPSALLVTTHPVPLLLSLPWLPVSSIFFSQRWTSLLSLVVQENSLHLSELPKAGAPSPLILLLQVPGMDQPEEKLTQNSQPV